MGWGTPSAITGTTAAASNGNITPPGLPTHSAGDALFFALSSRYNGGGPGTFSVAGYTQAVAQTFSGNHRVELWMKKAGASESVPTGTISGGGAGGTCLGYMWAATGGDVDNLATIAVNSITKTSTAGATIETDTLTPGADNCLVLALGVWNDDYSANSGISSIPSWATSLGSHDSSLGGDASLLACYAIQTSATNVAASNWTIAAGSAIGAAVVVALRSATPAGHPAARRFEKRIIGVESVRIY